MSTIVDMINLILELRMELERLRQENAQLKASLPKE